MYCIVLSNLDKRKVAIITNALHNTVTVPMATPGVNRYTRQKIMKEIYGTSNHALIIRFVLKYNILKKI